MASTPALATVPLDVADVPLDDIEIEGFIPEGLDEEEADTPVGESRVPHMSALPDLQLDDETRDAIALHLNHVIEEEKSARQGIVDIWQEIQRWYEMMELDESKDFPFEDSAKIVVPIIPMFVETIYAKINNTVFTPADPVTPKPARRYTADGLDLHAAAKALQKFLTWASKNELQLRKSSQSAFLELTKLGACIAKVTYELEDQTVFVYDRGQKKYIKTRDRIKDNPVILSIPLADFFFPISAKSLDPVDCPWQAHRVKLKWSDVKKRVEQGIFRDTYIDEYEAFQAKQASEYENSLAEARYEMPMDNDDLEFYECWFEYVIKGEQGNGDVPVRLIAWLHPDTLTLARIQHNWYPLQLTPFEDCAYIPREHHVHGIGVGQQALVFEKEISVMHNQRLDSATIANANVTLIKDDSLLPLNLRLKPGATLVVSDVNEIKSFPLGQRYDSTIQEEQHTLSLVQQRVGIQDYMQQMTAGGTSTQAIINMQELTRKFDLVIYNVRDFYSRIMRKVVLLYQQHYPTGKIAQIMGEQGELVERLFEMSARELYTGMAIELTATTSTTSKELERQAKLSLFNLVTQYYGQLVQYSMQAANPQLPEELRSMFTDITSGLTQLVRSVLEDFDITDREDIIPGPEPSVGVVNPFASLFPTPNPGAATGSEGDAAVPGMGDISQLLGSGPGAGAAGPPAVG